MSLSSKILKELEKKPRRFRELRDRIDDKKMGFELDELVRRGQVRKKDGMFYATGKKPEPVDLSNAVPCTLVKLGKSFGFAAKDDGSGDIFVPGSALMGAMPGDKILVSLYAHPRVEGSAEGQVVQITEPHNRFVGTIVKTEDGRLALQPDRCPATLLVLKKSADGGAQLGEKAAVEILERGERHSEHRAGVSMRFGSAEIAAQCAKALLYDRGIERHFPQAVKAEGQLLENAQVSAKEMEGRMDLRPLPIFTIDSAETKDIDDAISVNKVSDGFELGVHIADVSHYVTPGSELDKEAFHRATSVYYANNVVPMLPRALSNGICSLNEDAVRLAFSCLMKLDKNGNLVDYRFVKSVIRSRVKGVYSEINALLAGTAEPAIETKYAAVRAALPAMKELFEKRDALRKARGGMEIESDESKLVLDENGVCVDVVKRSRGLSECIIEEFMLLANQCAANLARVHKLPFVYRVHEAPDAERIERLHNTLNACGVNAHFAEAVPTQAELAAILNEVRGTGLQQAVNVGVLRSMAKAKYEPVPKGHYGLALEDYAHFTSPIRRYPDLSIHRIMTDFLAGIPAEELQKRYGEFVTAASIQSSEQEVTAMQVERSAEDCYKAEYLHSHIGETYPGTISGVTAYGVYVALENTVEGMLSAREICKGAPVLTEGVRLSDPVTGRSFMLGGTVNVTVAAVDVALGRIDFALA